MIVVLFLSPIMLKKNAEEEDELLVSIILPYYNYAFIKPAVLNTYKHCRYIEVHLGPYRKVTF